MVTERVIIQVKAQGVKTVQRDLKKIGTTSKSTAASVKLLKRSLTFLGVGLIGRAIFNQLRNFEQSMSTVKAITAATTGEFKTMTATARTLGATTRFTATQAAEGMVFLGRTGFDTNEILATIRPTLNLAQAGALDFASAADIATNVLKGFRLEAEDMNRVVDVLAKGAASSNTNVLQLGKAMSFVAPVAAGLKISLEETAAAVGALSDAGIQADRAGTGLRQVLGALQSPSSKAKKIFKELGITLDSIKPSSVGLTAALKALSKGGIDATNVFDVFSKRAAPAFLVLASGVKDVETLRAKLKEAGGTAEEIARIMDDNLNGAFLRTVSALQELAFSFNETFLGGTLRLALEGIAVTVRFLADKLDELRIIAIGAAAALILLNATAIFAAVVSGFESMAIAALLFNSAVLANPLVAIGAAIAGVIAIFVLWKDELLVTTDGITTLGDVISATFGFIKTAFQGVLGFITQWIPGLNTTKSLLQNIFDGVEFVAGAFLKVADIIIQGPIFGIRFFLAFIEEMPGSVGVAFRKVGNAMIEGVEFAIGVMVKAMNKLPWFNVSTPSFSKFKFNTKESGSTLGGAFAAAFAKASRGPLTFVLEGILQEAKNLAAERENALAESLNKDPRKDAKVKDDTAQKDLILAAKRSKLLKDVNEDLDRQILLLGLEKDVRADLAAFLAIEDQFKDKGFKLSKQETADLKEKITLLRIRTDEVERQEALFKSIRGPQEDFTKNVAALNSLLKDGKIDVEEYTKALDKLRLGPLANRKDFTAGLDRAAIRIGEQFTDVAKVTEDAFVNAFRGAEDALVEFVATGKFSFNDLVNSIIKDLTRIAVRQAITGPLAGAIGSAGGAGGISSLLSGIFGGGGGSNLGADFFGAGNFAGGGSFTVGGQGGTDSQLVAFRASPKEQVTVSKPGEGGGRPITIIVNVQTPDATTFRRDEAQIGARIALEIQRNSARNN